jgi:hypothetical protein
VFFHVRDIPLSEVRKKEICLAATRRIAAYSRSIKGKSRFQRHPVPFEIWDAELVSLLAHILFDGTVTYGGCVYTNRSEVLLDHVTKYMYRAFPYPPKRYESVPGVYKVAFHSVELQPFLRKKKRELITVVSTMTKELQRVFLRAFFDDEGSVYFIGNRRAIRGYQHDEKILWLIQKLLKDFGIESTVGAPYNEITITRRENIERFAKEINFTAGVRVNGLRKNSIWKQSLEKRNILANALASYQR